MPGKETHSRRNFIRTTAAGAGAITLTGLSGCTSILGGGGSSGPLSVAVYGGAFKDVMDEQLFKPFREQADFEVESKAAPTAEEALTQYDNAVAAGEAPVDVAIMANTGVLKGLNRDLWHFWESGDFDNLQYITDNLVKETDNGIAGIGALSWYINLVQNTNEYPNLSTRGKRSGTTTTRAASRCSATRRTPSSSKLRRRFTSTARRYWTAATASASASRNSRASSPRPACGTKTRRSSSSASATARCPRGCCTTTSRS